MPIHTGAAVYEDIAHNLVLADASHLAFAVCFTGGIPGGIASWRNSTGFYIFRKDWTAITATALLQVGATYYLSAAGRLATSGFQRIGFGQDPNNLRLDIQPPSTVFPPGFGGIPVTGDWPMAPDLITGTVSGLGLSFTPSRVVLSVRAPVGSTTAFYANGVGSPTSDGFDYVIGPGFPTTSDYLLHYVIYA